MNLEAFAINERRTAREYWNAPSIRALKPQTGGYISPFNVRRGADGRLWVNQHGAVFSDPKAMQFVMIRRASDHWYLQVYFPLARIAEFNPAEDWAPSWEHLPDANFAIEAVFQGEYK